MNDERARTLFYLLWSYFGEKKCYLDCTLILYIHILTPATIWYEYREFKILPQVQKFINIWSQNIAPEQKSPQYLSSWNNKSPSYMRNIPWKWVITTIIRTYHIDHDIKGSQIITGTRLSGMCTRKQYILIYIPVLIGYSSKNQQSRQPAYDVAVAVE